MWRDWALLAVLAAWSVLETMLREDPWWATWPEANIASRPLVLTVSLVVAVSLLWRRTHPLAAVAVAFGTLIAFDVARILAVDGTGCRASRRCSCCPTRCFVGAQVAKP